jgi:hypothetical protein
VFRRRRSPFSTASRLSASSAERGGDAPGRAAIAHDGVAAQRRIARRHAQPAPDAGWLHANALP